MGKESSTISRRGFLKFAGKTAAVSAAFLSGCAQNSMQPAERSAGGLASAIDIHHHYFPPELIDEIKQHGQSARRHRVLSSKASQRQSLSNSISGGGDSGRIRGWLKSRIVSTP